MAESDTAVSFNLKAGLTIDIYQDIVSYITLSHVQNTYKSYTDIVPDCLQTHQVQHMHYLPCEK